MILRRVTLAGFLCYREEQTVRFDAAGLWVLSGPNGSGKSTILDAVTYALYGKIRGSGHLVEDLINHHADRLRVDVEFEIDGRICGIQRTRRRGGGATVGAYAVVGTNPDGSPQKDPISDTHGEAGLRRWVEQTIGLNLDAFTSSVLLRQGQSDRLLSLTPRERAAVLNQLIDLSRYRELHRLVKEGRTTRLATIKGIEQQLNSIPLVTEEALTAAAAAVEAAAGAAKGADADVERLSALLPVAERARDLRGELEEVRQKRDADRALVERQDEIESCHARLTELTRLLPDLTVVIGDRRRLADHRGRAAAADDAIATICGQSATADAELSAAQTALDAIETAINGLRDEQNTVLSQIKTTLPLVALLDDLERQSQELEAAQTELGRYPTDLADQLTAAEARATELAEIETALPWLDNLATARQLVASATVARSSAESRLAGADAALVELGTRVAASEARENAAAAARDAAAHTRTRHDQSLNDAAQRIRQFDEAANEPVCSLCGQPISPEHAETERATLRAALDASERKAAGSRAALETAERAHLEAKEEHAGLLAERDCMTDEQRRHRNERDLRENEVNRAVEQAEVSLGHLPEQFAHRIAPAAPRTPEEWWATSYPTPDDLLALRSETDDIAATKDLIDGLRQQRMDLKGFIARADGARQRIGEIEGQHERTRLIAAREEQTILDARRAELDELAERRRAVLPTHKERFDAAAQTVEQIKQSLNQHERERDTSLSAAEEIESGIARAYERLPGSWQEQSVGAGEPELALWKKECADLEPYTELARHLVQVQARASEMNDREQRAREALAGLPPESNRAPDEIRDELGAARVRQERTRSEQVDRSAERATLQERCRQRDELSCSLRTTARDHHLHTLLEKQLGDDGLLRHLLRRAERAIVDDATRVLDRLSGGRLRLDLRTVDGAAGDDELDLVVRDNFTGTRETPVDLTSGSQRFRIAVSLALAIGHYLGQEANRVQSVVVDEGFGSLDRDGLATMIEELRRLEGELRRIVLVSHQEEIAQAFPRGYTVGLVDGAAVIKRIGE